jgi:penicillin-insensitive murein endopeptidase
MRRITTQLVCAAIGLAVSAVAFARPTTPSGRTSDVIEGEGRAVGTTTRGHLVRGVRLEESGFVRHVPRFVELGDRVYGTDDLVGLLERAAKYVAPDGQARLSVGDLSRRNGGRIIGHRSHRNGRDADLGFYLVNEGGKPVYASRFVGVSSSGQSSAEGAPARFDDERNFRLVEALLTDPYVDVQYIFVANTLRRRILAQAERYGVHDGLRQRMEQTLHEPDHGHPHRDHFHVRIYCPPTDQPQCEDKGHVWPWSMEPRPRLQPLSLLVTGS